MRNLNPQMTPENLRFRLCEVLSTYASKIVKVHKSLDYAFIHFATRLTAEIALHILQGKTKRTTMFVYLLMRKIITVFQRTLPCLVKKSK